jgi:hypothetical protein
MAMAGPILFFFDQIRLVSSSSIHHHRLGLVSEKALAPSPSAWSCIGLVSSNNIHHHRLGLVSEVIGPGIMVCVTFDHYNLWIYASNSFYL